MTRHGHTIDPRLARACHACSRSWTACATSCRRHDKTCCTGCWHPTHPDPTHAPTDDPTDDPAPLEIP